MARCRKGAATLVELASLFGVNRRTVATHLTRRGVTIRRGRFDPSHIHEAADLYLSGLTRASDCVSQLALVPEPLEAVP